jgi:hypothetical protein
MEGPASVGVSPNSRRAVASPQCRTETISLLTVSDPVKGEHWERTEDTMEALKMAFTSDASLCVFDERGGLIGTIHRPLARDPLGPGRETVYLERPAQSGARPAAAA